MSSRQRVLTTREHRRPDRPRVFMTLTPQVAERLADAVGLPREPPADSLLSTRISHPRLLTHLGNPAVDIAACAPPGALTRREEDGTLVNELGDASSKGSRRCPRRACGERAAAGSVG